MTFAFIYYGQSICRSADGGAHRTGLKPVYQSLAQCFFSLAFLIGGSDMKMTWLNLKTGKGASHNTLMISYRIVWDSHRTNHVDRWYV
jgi:hypothetical protein